MKVLCFIDSLVPAGAELGIVTMAAPLRSLGVTLEVAYLRDRPGLQDMLRDEGTSVFCLDGGQGRAGLVRRAVQHVRSSKPDIVHTTLYEANVVGRIAGALTGTPTASSLVNVMYGPEQRGAPGLQPWKVHLAQLLDGLTAQKVIRFHALSHVVADVMSHRLRISRTLIDVVPRGRDPKLLGRRTDERRKRVREQLGIATRAPLVLAVARHEHQKGLDVLLDGFAIVRHQHPAAQLLVAGRHGNQTRRLQAIIAERDLGSAVRLLGTRPDVPDLLAATDVFTFPSRWEGLGSVLIEAMALEAPIVTSDLPATREVVSDGRLAVLVPPGLPAPLAAAITTTLSAPRAATERAHQARRRFLARFTIDQVAQEMSHFYDRVLAGAQGHAFHGQTYWSDSTS